MGNAFYIKVGIFNRVPLSFGKVSKNCGFSTCETQCDCAVQLQLGFFKWNFDTYCFTPQFSATMLTMLVLKEKKNKSEGLYSPGLLTMQLMNLVTETESAVRGDTSYLPQISKNTVTVPECGNSKCDFGDFTSISVTEYISVVEKMV